MEEYAQLADLYGANFTDEVRDTRESLDEISNVRYEIPVFDDVEAAIALLHHRKGGDVDLPYFDGHLKVCSCGGLLIQVHEEDKCKSCGMVHKAGYDPTDTNKEI